MNSSSEAGVRGNERLAFSEPYERDGVTVIPATAVRTHLARRERAGDSPLHAELSGTRPAGAIVIRDGRVQWRPAIDVTRVVTTAEVVIGAVLIAHKLAGKPGGAIAKVTMGPGGWVSMKGGALAVRPANRIWRRLRVPTAPPSRRPVWARMLAAKTLESLLN